MSAWAASAASVLPIGMELLGRRLRQAWMVSMSLLSRSAAVPFSLAANLLARGHARAVVAPSLNTALLLNPRLRLILSRIMPGAAAGSYYWLVLVPSSLCW